MRPARIALGMALLMSASILVAACGDDAKPSGRRRRNKKKKPSAAADASGAQDDGAKGRGPAQEGAAYSFNDNFSGRDPFRSYIRDFAVSTGEEDEGMDQIRTHLERFDLSELRPIAIITGTPVPKAMVTDPSGMGHVIQPGTRLGRRGGKVVRISTNAIVVRHVDEELGTVKETRIRLHDDEEEGKYRLNVVRHDLEANERAKAQAKESVLEGIDIDSLLKNDGPAGGGRGGGRGTPAEKPAMEGGTY